MWKTFFLICAAEMAISLLSFFLPVATDPTHPFLIAHIAFAITLAMFITFTISGLIMLWSLVYIKTLGGIVGFSLRLLGIGITLTGLFQIQALVITYFNWWNSAYALSPYYLLPTIIAIGFMALGLIIPARNYTKKALAAFGVVAFLTIVFGSTVGLLPEPFIDHASHSQQQLQGNIWIDSCLTGFIILMVWYSILLRQSFGKSSIGDEFGYLIVPFLIFTSIGILNFYFDTHTWPIWVLNDGAFFALLLLVALSFFFFSLKLLYASFS